MLAGTRLLIAGVVTTDSIAFATAVRSQALGAEAILTTLERDRALCEEAAGQLPVTPDALALDVTQPDDFGLLVDQLRQRRTPSTEPCTRSPSRHETRWPATSWPPAPTASTWPFRSAPSPTPRSPAS